MTPTPTDVDAGRHRRLGCAGVVLPLLAGAVLGYVTAAVVDLLTTVEWRGAWTGAAVGGGAAVTLGLVVLLVKTGRTTSGTVRRVARGLWWLREPAGLVASLGAVYAAIWVVGPDLTRENVIEFGLVGVVAWPMLAGTVRILFGRPPLRPPWWAALWLFIGAGPSTVILLIRADHLTQRIDGVIGGVVLLIPVAVWRWVRTRRRLPRGRGLTWAARRAGTRPRPAPDPGSRHSRARRRRRCSRPTPDCWPPR